MARRLTGSQFAIHFRVKAKTDHALPDSDVLAA